MRTPSARFISIASILLLASLSACKKKSPGGTAVITVKMGTQNLPNVMVYMQQGIEKHPGTPLSEFTASAETNSGGVAFFSNLPADSYYFFASAVLNGDTVSGSTALAIAGSGRREMVIRLK